MTASLRIKNGELSDSPIGFNQISAVFIETHQQADVLDLSSHPHKFHQKRNGE
jgi:hypothetical protein